MTTALAQKSTLSLDIRQRMLGRMIEVNPGKGENDLELDASYQDLASDAFWEYFAQSPKISENIPAERELNRRLLDWARGSNGWESSRNNTVGQLLTSAISAGLLTQQLATDKDIRDALEKQKEAEKQAQEAEKQATKAAEAAAAGDTKAAEAALKKSDTARKQANAQGKAAAEAMQAIENNGMKQAVRAKAVRDANEKSKEIAEIAGGWGLNTGTPSSAEAQEIIKTLAKYGDLLKKITPLIGRVKSISSRTRGEQKKPTDVIVQDGYTRQLENTFPSELALLRPGCGMLRAVKTAEWAERGLIGMIPGASGKEDGGLIIAVDESGSMAGDRLIKAKALALGIAQAARENGQPWRLFSFSTVVGDTLADTADPQTMMSWASGFMAHGTNYNASLTRAMELVSEFGEQAKNTDIVFISDGECVLQEKYIAAFRETQDIYGTRLIYLSVGDHDYAGSVADIAHAKLQLGDNDNLDNIAEELSRALER